MAGGSAGNAKGGASGSGVKAPSPPGQHPMKAAMAAAPAMGDMARGKSPQTGPAMAAAGDTFATNGLNQTKKTPYGPRAVMAGGLAVVATIAYIQLNSKNKVDKMDENAVVQKAGK